MSQHNNAHAHTHSHKHRHKNIQSINKKFIAGILLNLAFIIIEVIYGLKANSMALIADAAHNAGDICSLFIAWFGYLLAHKKATKKFTYGFKNATIIAAFINAVLLFIAVGFILWKAFGMLSTQQTIAPMPIIFVAAIGVIINGLAAYFFYHERNQDINLKAAFLHMLLDACILLGVFVGGLIMLWTSWTWVDPLISLLIAVAIMVSSWKLFKESLDLMLLGVPTSINLEKLKQDILEFEGVIGYHDLHIWPISTTEIAMSVHITVDRESFTPILSNLLAKKLSLQHKINHPTIQLETEEHAKVCYVSC